MTQRNAWGLRGTGAYDAMTDQPTPQTETLSVPSGTYEDGERAGIEGVLDTLRELDEWLMHPTRSYTPHELSMEVHGRIGAILAAKAVR